MTTRMRLHALSCGRIGLPGDYLWPGWGDATLVDCSVGMFVLEHPGGLLLFDTGSAPETASSVAAHWGEAVAAAFPYRVDRADIIDRQLAALGFRPADVRQVVLSHLHLDHAGGMKLFPEATFFVQAQELLDAFWPLPGFAEGYYLPADLLPCCGFRMIKLEGDVDLFGHGSIRLLSTPGHATGHQSLALTLPHTGPVILPADACFNPVALERRLPPGAPLPAPSAWKASLERVAAAVQGGATPLWSHLPWGEWERTPRVWE